MMVHTNAMKMHTVLTGRDRMTALANKAIGEMENNATVSFFFWLRECVFHVSFLDIDECVEKRDNCSLNADCIDEEGGFRCECDDGYTGDGVTCSDIDECTVGSAKCPEYSQCVNENGKYSCLCDDGFRKKGPKCKGEFCLSNFVFLLM